MTDPWGIATDILDPPGWKPIGRPELNPKHQLPPEGDWNLWILEGSRGAGKTEASATYFARFMREKPGSRGRIIAPTFGDAVEACVEGDSGLLAIDPAIRWVPGAAGGSKVIWPNGSEALVLGTPFPRDVERLRAAGNRHLDWWEEMAANAQLAAAWDQAQFGLRLGPRPHSIASTTPRPTKAYRTIRAGAGVALTHGTLDDNPGLSDEWKAQIRARYEGTRLGRQELGGELIDDVEGALWTWAMIEAGRVEETPDLAVVVVAVDPAVSSGPAADDTGIVAFGRGADGDGYVLADRTCHLPPESWGHRAIHVYSEQEADRIVAEVNNGGDLVEALIRGLDRAVPVKKVRASRGKQTRAEPIAALYGDPTADPPRPPRIHHVGAFPALEDQMTTWVPGDADSPDRVDALVWGATDTMLGKEGSWRPL